MSAHPRRRVLVTGVLATLAATTLTTLAALVGLHVVAATVMIPALARRLGDRHPVSEETPTRTLQRQR